MATHRLSTIAGVALCRFLAGCGEENEPQDGHETEVEPQPEPTPLHLNACTRQKSWPDLWREHHGVAAARVDGDGPAAGQTAAGFRDIERQLAKVAVERGPAWLVGDPEARMAHPTSVIPRQACDDRTDDDTQVAVEIEFVAEGTFFTRGQRDSLVIAGVGSCPRVSALNQGQSYFLLDAQGRFERLPLQGGAHSGGYYNVGDVNDDGRDDLLFIELSSRSFLTNKAKLVSFSDAREPRVLWESRLTTDEFLMGPSAKSNCIVIKQAGPGQEIVVSGYNMYLQKTLEIQ